MPVALITGVTGQDGGYLAERLAADGHVVHGLVRPGEDVGPLVQRCPNAMVHAIDLADGPAIVALLAAADIDEIYNLAGVSSVAQSWADPLETAQVNGLGAARLLEFAHSHETSRARPVRFLQASSAEIFGDADAPQSELTPVRPISPYGAAKAFAHHLVHVYRQRGMAAASVILYNHESPRRPPTFVTRKITQAVARIAAGHVEQLTLGNLESRRDWGWAPDYVDAMVRVMRHPVADDWVIATGEARSVADFVEAAFARVGIRDWRGYVNVESSLERPGDARLQLGDSSRARSELGWAPTLTFEELVGRMVDADVAELQLN